MSSKRSAALGLAGLLWSSVTALAQNVPPLGASASFAVLGGSAVRNTGSSLVTGNLGVSPGTTITGSPTVQLGDVRNDLAAGAQSDAAIAYGLLGAGTCGGTQGSTLPPGVYCLSPTLAGTLTLDGGGNDGAVWIFRGDSLTTVATSAIRLINGAHASNVFWRITGTATLGPKTAFAGTLLAQGDVTLGSGTSVSGRVIALGRASAVSLDNSSVSLCCPQITVFNPDVATATINASFNQSFSQQGADHPLFTLTNGRLPAGLTLTQGGTLSGTPAERGSFPLVVRVTDGAGCTGTSAIYTLTVGCQSIAVVNPVNTLGVAGAQFSEKFQQSGAVGAATFTTTSHLPSEFYLDTDGTLHGVPLETGCFPIVVTVTDSNGCTGTTTYVLCIGCQPITVSCPVSTNGTAGAPFSATFSETGAMGTATFTLAAGTLPAGFALQSNGVLSGTTNQTGCFTITVKVTDSNGCSGTVTCTFCFGCQPISVINPAVTSGTEGVFFSQPFTATGILGLATFTTADPLPAGLSPLGSNGVLSGTPTETGVFVIHVTATDTNGCSATGAPYTLTISAAPPPPPPPCPDIFVTPATLPPAVATVAYLQGLTATGGTAPYTFTVTGGALPNGLSLVPTGPATASITGIPTVSAEMNLTITASDANGCVGNTTPVSIPTVSCCEMEESEMVDTAPAEPKKRPCKVCKTPLPRGAEFCDACKSWQGPPCKVCGQRLPKKAAKCNACGEYQGWLRRTFPIVGSALDHSKTLIAVITPLVGVAFYVKTCYSDTSVTVTNIQPSKITLNVRNTGREPSQINRVVLEFNELPYQNAELEPEDPRSTLIPAGRSMTSIGAPVQGVRVEYRIKDLRLKTDTNNKTAPTLFVEVEESNRRLKPLRVPLDSNRIRHITDRKAQMDQVIP
jgi:hypothetical protein